MTDSKHVALLLTQEEQDRRDQARRSLYKALRDAGHHVVLKDSSASDPSITVTLVSLGGRTLWGPSNGLPTQDPAAPLRRYLDEHHVNARAAMDGDTSSLHITLAGAADAERLTDLVLQSLPPERRAARRLTQTFFNAGLARPVDGVSITAGNGRVNIGDLYITYALQLWALLGGGEAAKHYSPHEVDWRQVEEIAEQMEAVVSTVCGEQVSVEPDPVCSSCAGSRDDQIALGQVSPDGADRLADAIETALRRAAPDPASAETN